MNEYTENENIFYHLIQAVKNAAANIYDHDQSVFEMAKTDKYPAQIADLAESFGMMIVKLEARELRLEQTIRKLQQVHEKLRQELQKKQDTAAALQKERNRLEDLVRQRRGEILKSNHKLQLEILARKRIEEEREQLIMEMTYCPSARPVKKSATTKATGPILKFTSANTVMPNSAMASVVVA